MELATPFNRRLVSSTPDPEKIALSPAVFFAQANQGDGSDSDDSTLIGDADYLNDDLEDKPKHDNRPNLKQKPGAKARKLSSGHKEGRRTSSAPNSSAPQGSGSLVPPHPVLGAPVYKNSLPLSTLFSLSSSCLPKAQGVHDKLPTTSSAPLALPLGPAVLAGVSRSRGMVGQLPDRQQSAYVQIGNIPGSMKGRKSGSCGSLAEVGDSRARQGLSQAPPPREVSPAQKGRAILGRKMQLEEGADSDPTTQTQLPASYLAATPKCLPSPTELGVRSAFPGAPEEGSSPPAAEPHCHHGPRKSSDDMSAAADQPCMSRTSGQGDASTSAKQPPTSGSQARPGAEGKVTRPTPKQLSPREAEEREMDDEVFSINNPPARPLGGSLVDSLASLKWTGPYHPYSPPPLCANGSIHRCPPNPRFSPTPLPNSPTSPTPPSTSPPRLSPMPFAQAAGEFNSNARFRSRCDGQSALSQLGEARPVQQQQPGPAALQQSTAAQLAQVARLEELNRAIHNTIQLMRNRALEEGPGSEWEEAARELEDAAKGCPYLRPGFLTAELESTIQPWKNHMNQLQRRIKTLNAQLSERERQIRDLRRPASEADREEQNEDCQRLQRQLREVVQKLRELERQADFFQQENQQLREEKARWRDSRQQEDETRLLRLELETAKQSLQRMSRSKAQQQQQSEREQQERMLALSTQTTLLQDEKVRLQKENAEIKARLASMQSQLKRAQEESERERERRREEMQRQNKEVERRMAAVQEACAAQREADELREELRSLKEEHLNLRKNYETVTNKLDKVEEINRTLKDGVATVLRRVEQGGSNGCPSSSKSPPLDSSNLQHILRSLCSQPQPSPTSQSSAGPHSPQRRQGGDWSEMSSLETGPLSGQSSVLRADPPSQHSPNGVVEREARGMLSSSKGFSVLSPGKAAPSSPSTSTTLPRPYLDRSALAHSAPRTSSPMQPGKSREEDTSLYCISKKFLKGPRYPPSVEKERAGDLAGSPVDSSWDSEFENNNDPKATGNMRSAPGTGEQGGTAPARPFEGTQLDVSLSTIEVESVSSDFCQSTSTAQEIHQFATRINTVDQQMTEALTRLKSNNL